MQFIQISVAFIDIINSLQHLVNAKVYVEIDRNYDDCRQQKNPQQLGSDGNCPFIVIVIVLVLALLHSHNPLHFFHLLH